MVDIFPNLDISRLTSDEVVFYSPGLEAIQQYAFETDLTVSVCDVKHKRSGPVVECWIHGEGDEVAVENAFEKAIERAESTG
jgi:hypothetical protein